MVDVLIADPALLNNSQALTNAVKLAGSAIRTSTILVISIGKKMYVTSIISELKYFSKKFAFQKLDNLFKLTPCNL